MSRGAENAEDTDELAPEYHEDGGVGGDEDSEPVRNGGRAMRAAGRAEVNGVGKKRKRVVDDDDEDMDEMSEEDELPQSGDEWDSDQNAADDTVMPDADDEDESGNEDEESEDHEVRSLVVKLKVSPDELTKRESPATNHNTEPETNGDTSPPRPEPNGAAPKLARKADLADSIHVTQAHAGADDKSEPLSTLPNGIPHGYIAAHPALSSQQDPQSTSPTAASAYPTPASASFPPAEAKPTAPGPEPGKMLAHRMGQDGLSVE